MQKAIQLKQLFMKLMFNCCHVYKALHIHLWPVGERRDRKRDNNSTPRRLDADECK